MPDDTDDTSLSDGGVTAAATKRPAPPAESVSDAAAERAPDGKRRCTEKRKDEDYNMNEDSDEY